MIAKTNARKVVTDTIAPISALARMGAIVQIRTANASAQSDGRVSCASRLAGPDFMEKIVKNNAIVKMALHVITLLVSGIFP